MELQELYDSKNFVSNGGLTFGSAEDYVRPFYEMVEDYSSDFLIEIKTQNEIVNENKEDGTKNIAYPRFSIMAKLNEGTANGFKSAVGISLALDIPSKPSIKTWAGEEVGHCANFHVFNPQWVNEATVMNGFGSVYDNVQKHLENLEHRRAEFFEIYNDLRNTKLTKLQTHELMGGMLEKVTTKTSRLGTTPLIAASKLLFTPSSKYFIGENAENSTKWNIIQAVTQNLTDTFDRTVFERPSKTLEASKLILN